jgi:hypothetical protein
MIVGLVKELVSVPRLRLVLIGWLATLPAGFADSIENLTVPTEDEAVDLLMDLGYDADSEQPGTIRATYLSVLGSGLSGYPAIRRAKKLLDERREGGAG